MTNYKQLCTELVDELEDWIAYGDEIDIANAHLLIDRARAALADPTDEELTEMFSKWWYSKGRALTPGGGDEDIRSITETGWRNGGYIADLTNPRLSRPATP